jgi:flavin reductase
MNRSSSAYVSVTGNNVVCVNVLSAQQEPLSRLFGGKVSVTERFASAMWSTLETGAPVLPDCAVAFDCQIASVTTVGTHDVLFCRVVALRRYGLTENLIYLGRAYHSVRTCSN